MKRLFAVISICCLCSCDDRRGGGSGGPSAHIDVSSLDEPAVIQNLESWLTDHGYEKRSESWSELTGDGAVANNDGEVVYPASYVKEISEGRGHIAFGVASATENHEFVTVFHDSDYVAGSEEALDKIEEDVNGELLAFRNYVDTGLSSLAGSGKLKITNPDQIQPNNKRLD